MTALGAGESPWYRAGLSRRGVERAREPRRRRRPWGTGLSAPTGGGEREEKAAVAAVEEAMGGAEGAGRRRIHTDVVVGTGSGAPSPEGGSEIEREKRTVLVVGPTERKTKKQNKNLLRRKNKETLFF